MTPRSRSRNTTRYGQNAPLPQGGAGSGVRGGTVGPNPPTINIVDSSGHQQQQLPHHAYNLGSSVMSLGVNNPTHFGAISASASLPSSPCASRSQRQQLPGGGGSATFYWAAKVYMFIQVGENVTITFKHEASV